MTSLWSAVADLLEAAPMYAWSCSRPDCDGMPHDGLDRHARTDQQPPTGNWSTWLIRAGRGWGKTRTGAETLIDMVIANPLTVDGTPTEWLAAGETIQASREVCALGPSGLIAALDRRGVEYTYNRAFGVIKLSPGQRIHLRGGDDHDLARGMNLAGAWLDELGTWKRAPSAWSEGVVPALRQQLPNTWPRVVITTTPKPGPGGKLLADLASRDDGTVAVTRGSTFDNAANLSTEALDELRRRYPEGSRLYRQELLGELVNDVEGALWNMDLIDAGRDDYNPDNLTRVVVAVDPAASYGPDSDETGIVIAGSIGSTRDRHYMVLADVTVKAEPSAWGKAAVTAWAQHDADAIVYETNQGGAMVAQVLTQSARDLLAKGLIDRLPKLVPVRATRGKALRAEPIAALYEMGRVHHAPGLSRLEEQMTTWTPESPTSPDRLDALVWALTHLSKTGTGLAGAF